MGRASGDGGAVGAGATLRVASAASCERSDGAAADDSATLLSLSSATVASVSPLCSAEAEAEAEAAEAEVSSLLVEHEAQEVEEVEEVEAQEERRCGRLGLACANCCAR